MSLSRTVHLPAKEPYLKVLAYIRVSTEEQAASGLGLAAQEAALVAEIARRGWDLVEVVRDEGVSGKDLNRPGIQSALERLARREVDGLVVAKLDRLTRSLADLTDLLSWAERLDVNLVALDFGLDTSTPTGRLVARLVGSVAEWEREVISARTREAAAMMRLRGERWGGLAGVADTMPEVATRILHERAAGATWQAIADGLNRDEVPTVRGGACWRVSSVQVAGGYRRRPAAGSRTALPEGRSRRASAVR